MAASGRVAGAPFSCPASSATQAMVATRLPVAPWCMRWPPIHRRRCRASYSSNLVLISLARFIRPPHLQHLSAFTGRFMSRHVMVLWASVGLLLLAGCGKTAPAGPGSGASGASTGSATAPTPAQTPTHQPGGPIQTSGGASNVRLPAVFTVKPGGSLSPPTVSAPAGVPVVLTVISGDGKGHKVTAKIPPPPRMLTLPAGRRAAVHLGTLP